MCLGSSSDVLSWGSCSAAGPCLWTSPLSVTEHSLTSHESTASLKGLDGRPGQVSFGNTNRLYQLKLPYPCAYWFFQRTLSKGLWAAVALRVMAKAVLTSPQIVIFSHLFSNSVFIIVYAHLSKKMFSFRIWGFFAILGVIFFLFVPVLLTKFGFGICLRLPWVTFKWNSAGSENKSSWMCPRLKRLKGAIPGETGWCLWSARRIAAFYRAGCAVLGALPAVCAPGIQGCETAQVAHSLF